MHSTNNDIALSQLQIANQYVNTPVTNTASVISQLVGLKGYTWHQGLITPQSEVSG